MQQTLHCLFSPGVTWTDKIDQPKPSANQSYWVTVSKIKQRHKNRHEESRDGLDPEAVSLSFGAPGFLEDLASSERIRKIFRITQCQMNASFCSTISKRLILSRFPQPLLNKTERMTPKLPVQLVIFRFYGQN